MTLRETGPHVCLVCDYVIQMETLFLFVWPQTYFATANDQCDAGTRVCGRARVAVRIDAESRWVYSSWLSTAARVRYVSSDYCCGVVSTEKHLELFY